MELQYKQLKLHDAVLHRPDTYVGSIFPEEVETFVFQEGRMVFKKITVIPALVRVFVEVLSNALDNKVRSEERDVPFKHIKVDITPTQISVLNDGLTIPVRLVEGEDIYIPHMIFGRLLSSTNYNDQEQRLTSGRNGLGVKLTNIFSREFSVKLRDTITGHDYEQSWNDNMRSVGKPKIRKKTVKSGFTQVTWTADFERFGLTQYTEDMMALFSRYVVDASLSGATITLNGVKLKGNGLKNYVTLFSGEEEKEIRSNSPLAKEVQFYGSECAVIPSREFRHTAFVNGVHTKLGGTHVDAWSKLIFKPLLEKLRKRLKSDSLTLQDVRNRFHIFVNISFPNPVFESQSKHQLKSSYKPPVKSVKVEPLLKWEFVRDMEALLKVKDQLALHKSVRTQRKIVKIKGYDPANKAGSKHSDKCTLILCEGDSAKAFGVKGISKGIDFGDGLRKGRDWFGVMPLKGKVMNVQTFAVKSIMKNKEIVNMIQALNLQTGLDYTKDENFRKLNYGRILVLCDSDVDGYHIQGLIFNFIHTLYPSLLHRKGFMYSMATQIITITKGSQVARYYDRVTAEEAIQIAGTRARIKYYKGLGTSTNKDIKETFGEFVIHYYLGEQCPNRLKDAFDSKKADLRKEWLRQYSPAPLSLPKEMNYKDFIDRYLIQYSYDNCDRSLPALMDGLKECQRKILFTARSGKRETEKVAQLAARTAGRTHYHHGEKCLEDAIVKMAQTFVGSNNNIPLLVDDGQFGTRLTSGDAASARYIFTKLRSQTNRIFIPEDDPVLTYLHDEGVQIEPKEFVPIIPMILVNGANSIATGWSCSVPCHNPIDVVEAVKCWIQGESLPELTPWYKGFTGLIERSGRTTYNTFGRVEREGKYVHVRELPIGMWTDKFKERLEDLRDTNKLKFDNYSTAEEVHFRIRERDGFECSIETLGLITTLRTSNMVLLDQNRIEKYPTVHAIIERWCERRLGYYQKRLHHQLKVLEESLAKCLAKQQFIQLVMANPSLQDEEVLKAMIHDLYRVDGSHDYLLNQPMRNLNQSQLVKLQQLEQELREKLAQRPTARGVWLNELSHFVS